MKSDCPTCNRIGGPLAICVVCGLRKKPRGRSAPLEMANGLCDFECPGYGQDPEQCELWPGERYGDSLGHFWWHEQLT